MTSLTLDEICSYCRARAVGVDAAPVGRLFFDRCADCTVYVGQFADAADAAFDTAAELLAPERGQFRGALVWAAGRYPAFANCAAAFDHVRAGLGAYAPIDEAPGHLFGPDEYTPAVVLMGFLMTFGWDVTWLPEHGEYLMAVNHDRFIDFAVRGGDGRWDTARRPLLDNLSLRPWPQMRARYCPAAASDIPGTPPM